MEEVRSNSFARQVDAQINRLSHFHPARHPPGTRPVFEGSVKHKWQGKAPTSAGNATVYDAPGLNSTGVNPLAISDTDKPTTSAVASIGHSLFQIGVGAGIIAFANWALDQSPPVSDCNRPNTNDNGTL